MATTEKSENAIVPEEVLNVFKELKIRRKHRYITLRIDQTNFHVEVDKIGSRDSTVPALYKALPITECRYIVYDLEYMTDDGRKVSKLLFIVWAPKGGSIESKMLLTMQKKTVVSRLTGGDESTCHSFADLDEVLRVKKEESESDSDSDSD